MFQGVGRLATVLVEAYLSRPHARKNITTELPTLCAPGRFHLALVGFPPITLERAELQQ